MTQLMASKNPHDKLSSGTGYSRAESHYTDARLDADTSFVNIPHLRDERCDPDKGRHAVDSRIRSPRYYNNSGTKWLSIEILGQHHKITYQWPYHESKRNNEDGTIYIVDPRRVQMKLDQIYHAKQSSLVNVARQEDLDWPQRLHTCGTIDPESLAVIHTSACKAQYPHVIKSLLQKQLETNSRAALRREKNHVAVRRSMALTSPV